MATAVRRSSPAPATRAEAWRHRKTQYLAQAAAGGRVQGRRRVVQAQAPARSNRTPWGTRPAPKRTTSRRRRYQSASAGALPWQGVRLVWPTLPRVFQGWRPFSLVLVALLAVALGNLLNAPEYFVESINMAGAQFVPGEEIYTAAQIDRLQIFWVDPERVAKNIETVPGIASARVETRWPNVVNVEVVERQAVLLWQQAGGVAWVDADGHVFPARADVPGLLPIAVDDSQEPITPAEAVPAEAVKGALRLKALRPNIELLHYDRLHGLSYQDGRGWRGYFGVGADMDLKLTVYETLVDNIWAQGIRPAVIDVGKPHAPYYRK